MGPARWDRLFEVWDVALRKEVRLSEKPDFVLLNGVAPDLFFFFMDLHS